jgi:Anti-sigma-K factor rskA, C-terminal
MDLRARMMADAEREVALLECAGQPERPEPNKRRSRRLQWPAGVVAALACSAALAGLGAGALLFASDGERTLAMQSQIQQASAELEVSDDGATLVANGLPPAPAGETYMVWLDRPGLDAPEPTSVLFTPRSDGSATAAVPGSLDDVEAVLVNTEALGGDATPTSAPVLVATLT